MQVSPKRYKRYVKCKLYILGIITIFIPHIQIFSPLRCLPQKLIYFTWKYSYWAWNTSWLSKWKYHNDTVCIGGRSRHERVAWDCIEKCKHNHKVLYGVDMLLLFDDYDNLKFKIEVHYVTIPKQVSINWKETLQINVTCTLQPFSNIASKFKYTGCRINLLHTKELLHCQSWHISYHKWC